VVEVADFVVTVEVLVFVTLLDLELDIEVDVLIVDVELDVLILELLLVVVIGPTTPPGPLTFEIPIFCRVVGRRGWINFCQTV